MKNLEKIKAFSFNSWEEGRYFDLWMIVHFFTGSIIGLVLALVAAPAGLANLLTLLALVLWEIFEHLIGVREAIPNIALDIIIGFFGFTLSYYNISNLDGKTRVAILIIILILTTILAYSGWTAFKLR